MLSNLWSDLRTGVRAAFSRPTYAAVVVLTLAFGIGVNVAVYSLAEQTLFRQLPVPDPDRLVNLSDPGPRVVGRRDPFLMPDGTPGGESSSGGPETLFSYPMFRDLERAQESFVGLAAHYTLGGVSLSIGERARTTSAILVSGSYFPVLGIQPALGRLLGPQDDRVNGIAESVVLNYSFWQTEFGGDPDVLGRTLRVNDVQLTIVGVAPRGFNGTTAISGFADLNAPVFVPITIPRETISGPAMALVLAPNHERRDFHWVHLFARLKPDITREEASAAVNPLFMGILSEIDAPLLVEVDAQQREAFRTRPLVLEAGARGQTNSERLSAMRIALLLLLAVSGFVLLLCCANVAGLVLVRATERTGEMAVRASMGASRGHLASLFLAESLVLALSAALLSLPVALSILRGPSRVPGMPDEFSLWLGLASEVSLSATAALVSVAIAVAAALAVALLPLRRLIRTEPAMTLQACGVRQTTAKGVARFRTTLATAQITLSMALLGVTFVFVHSVTNLTRVNLGLDLDSVTAFEVRSTGRLQNLDDQKPIAEAIEAIPGISLMATSVPALLDRTPLYYSMSVRGIESEPLRVGTYNVSATLLRMFGVELLAGRELDDADIDAGNVAIVSRRFAERLGLSPDEALGRTIDGAWGRPFEIVGVVADMRSGLITEEIEPRAFFPGGGSTYYVRSARPSAEIMDSIRETVARVDSRMTVSSMSTMEQQFLDSIAVERFVASMASAFAVLATALAALGLYGVLAYSVAQRSREIAMRIALGARESRIRRMVMRQVVGMAAIGVLLGATAASLLGRTAQSLLFSVGPGDPLALAAAAAVLMIVMLGAAYIPAHRASRVDPMTALRHE